VTTDLRAAVDSVLPGVRRDLAALVRIPSVSADPTRADDVRRSAQAVADLARDAGAAESRILSVGGGAPAVVASWPAPEGMPTVLLYAHHDVQPTGDRDAWSSDPFEPTERDGRLYGRGAADDKAGVLAHLAAVRAYGGRPPVGVTIFVEGEEEVGSPTFVPFLESHRDLLEADVIVVADSANWAVGVPALTTSLRGFAVVQAEVRTLDHHLHSGMYGGPVPDATTVLVRLLATLHDERGDVAVAGLTAGRASDVDYPEDTFRADAGLLDGVQLIGSGSIADRLWTRPAITVIGMDVPSIEGSAGVLQPVARAAVSARLAPGQDPDAAVEALTAHLTSHPPFGAHVTVTSASAGPATALDTSGRAYEAARAALREAWDGVEPVEVGIGGSIPFIAEIARLFPGSSVLVTGVEDPDSRAHGADESLHLAEFARVCHAEALLLDLLADR
jgi:acetylornithine deacetylase/succinyl-diaminopimelate desuccinylase-like protein